MSSQKKRPSWQSLRKQVGRRDWHGVNPVQRAVPGKKKINTFRKRKHKGRENDPFFVPESQPEMAACRLERTAGSPR